MAARIMHGSLSKPDGSRQAPRDRTEHHNNGAFNRQTGPIRGNSVEMTAKATDYQQADRDMRRDRRFQVSQAAIITQPGHPEIACEIRDFCQGGLFLKFTSPEAAIASLAKRSDAEVEIVFTPASAHATQTFRVPAQLKRLSPLGVGVAFVRHPIDALRALQKLRMAGHRQKLAALPASDAHPHLREASTTLLSETLLQVHDQMVRMLGDKLSAAALHASGIAEHSGLLNATHEFGKHAAAIQGHFVQQVMDALKQARPVRTRATRDTLEGGLELVDELAFEDWLATSSEANKLEEQFHEQLADIEPRIGQLFGFACDHSNNPFGPAVIGHAYRSALQDVPVLARARQVAYATLRDVLSDQLAPLYAELLALLPVSQAEVESHQPVVARQQPQADSPSPTPAAAADTLPAPAEPSAPEPGPVPVATAPQGTLSRLTGSLLDFFRGQPAPSPAPAAPGSAVPGAPAQGMTAAAASRPTRAGAPGIAHSPVLQRLAAAGALPPTVTQEMQHSVDMFGALFDTMHAEKSVSEGMRPFFQQLETSLIKLAMADPQFLSSPAHPAHRVLNTLDRLSMVAGDDGKIADARLLRLMNRWTDRINAEADKNPGVFEEARTQLERVVKPLLNERAARVFRLQEMCEGRQRTEIAKQRILRDLLARLDERPVPNAVIELLNGGWRNVLLMAEMRHGADSDEARAAWGVLQQLCEWLDPGQAAAPAHAGCRPPQRGRQRAPERSAGQPGRTPARRRLAAVQVARHPAQSGVDRRPAAGVRVRQLPRHQEARRQARRPAAIAGRRHGAVDRRPGTAADGPLLQRDDPEDAARPRVAGLARRCHRARQPQAFFPRDPPQLAAQPGDRRRLRRRRDPARPQHHRRRAGRGREQHADPARMRADPARAAA